MVLKAIINAIVKIIECAAKIIYFLLGALRLWVPVAYSLLFLIVCLATRTPLKSVAVVYFVGLALSFLLVIGVTILLALRARDIKAQEKSGYVSANVSGVKRRGDKHEQPAYYSVYGERRGVTPEDEHPTIAYYAGYTGAANGYAPAKKQAYGASGNDPDTEGSYVPYSPPPNDPEPETYARSYAPEPQENVSTHAYAQPSSHGATGSSYQYNGEPLNVSNEPAPAGARVFRTRMDPKMIIYEYDDRLMFYKETKFGPVHLSTEPKPGADKPR